MDTRTELRWWLRAGDVAVFALLLLIPVALALPRHFHEAPIAYVCLYAAAGMFSGVVVYTACRVVRARRAPLNTYPPQPHGTEATHV